MSSLAVVPARAAVYKCTVKGQPIFQQLPCKDMTHGKQLHIKVPPRASDFTDWEWGLIGKQQIAVGMSDKALRRSWGEPTEINRSSYGPAQWVYRSGPGRANYVYVENGKVTDWQD